MTYMAVFADYRFYGLYRSKSAAKRLVDELNQFTWQQGPIIKEVHNEFAEAEFLAFGWGKRAAYWSCLNAIECNYFGRIKSCQIQ